MRAVVTRRYGGTEVLEVRDDVDPPIPDEDEALVRVRATSVNPIDWKVRRGDYRVLTGLRPPTILGADYAGIVEAVGRRVTRYRPGDAVWGCVERFGRGTYAELVRVRPEEIDTKPECLSFEEAASLPLVGLTAYQALFDVAGLEAGQALLVNGASGGVGLAAVQIAKARGALVTGVCSTGNLWRVQQIGADEVIDYTRRNGDQLGAGGSWDVFFDVVANRSFAQVKPTLAPTGVYVRTLPTFQSLVLGPLLNPFRARKARTMDCRSRARDLATLRALVEGGHLVPVIERVYPLEEVAAAHERSETGHVVGKLVLAV